MKKRIIVLWISGIFILLWIYASGSKLADYGLFLSQLSRQPLPEWSIVILAWLLPLVEILIAICLSFEATRKIGLWSSFLLMVSFTLYVGLALNQVFGEIPCACAGILGRLQWKGHLIFNIIFSALALLAILLNKENPLREQKKMTARHH